MHVSMQLVSGSRMSSKTQARSALEVFLRCTRYEITWTCGSTQRKLSQSNLASIQKIKTTKNFTASLLNPKPTHFSLTPIYSPTIPHGWNSKHTHNKKKPNLVMNSLQQNRNLRWSYLTSLTVLMTQCSAKFSPRTLRRQSPRMRNDHEAIAHIKFSLTELHSRTTNKLKSTCSANSATKICRTSSQGETFQEARQDWLKLTHFVITNWRWIQYED